MSAQRVYDEHSEDVHQVFGLTYANYLVWHRTLMQSMPSDWQRRFKNLAEEYNTAWWNQPIPYGYTVNARNADGRFVRDPIPHYARGRTYIEPCPPTEAES